ncbi:MAG TPA: FAD-binding oxidoreductase [Chloroflexaceae bacterium]|nr:FAD-binding oxidoreductase [Chloroflexaceae bacterium]
MRIELPAAPAPRRRAHPHDQLQSLRAQLSGELITSAHPDFDAARRLRFINIDRRPLAIVRASGAQDVAAAVRYAGTHNLPLAVRSGGHSLAYHSVVDDGVVVDLSGMKRVHIDPVARTARVQPGATSGDLAGAAHAHGLALSTGDTHSVGMGGLTTGGGIGLMVRQHGLASDNLLAAHVVTADGAIVTASADEHPDLFWAIRGGGGNVGIVTEFTYRLAPVAQILGGMLFLPATREVIRGYLEYALAAPDELTTIADVMRAPPAPFVPAERVGELVLSILVCWTGDEADGQRALAPLRALAAPVAEAIGVMPYPAIYDLTAEAAGPHGKAIRSMFADQFSDAALDAVLAAMERASSPYSVVEFRALGGALARVGAAETAFAHRERRYFFAIIGLWFDAAEDPAVHNAWTEALWRIVRPEGAGVYVNFLEDEGAERVRDAYPPATFTRLAEVKHRYDPRNLFRLNQNVPPRA